RGGAPDQPSRARVEGVDVAVVGTDEEAPAGERDAALHLAAGLVAPPDLPGGLVERVDLSAPVSDVDEPVRDERRGLRRAGPRRPAHLPEADRERGDEAVEARLRLVARAAVHEAREDRAAVEGRRGRRAAMGLVRPGTAAVPRADREQRPGVVREEEAPVPDGGRKLEQARRAR